MNQEDLTTTPSGITLRQLQIFVVTAEAGSITKAAEKLFLSQTAVSLALQQLEKGLDATLLLRRRAHGITLTSTGQSLLPLGRNILASVADFGRSATGEGEMTGSVTVGCFPSLGPTLLPEIMEQFMREHPRASIHFTEASHVELMERLEMGTVDLVLTYRLGLPPGLIEYVVDEFRPGVLIAPDHPKAQGRDSIRLRELSDEPFIMLDSSVSREHARHIFLATKTFPQVRFRTTNFETVRSLVGRQLGWSLSLQRPRTTVTHEGREVRILDVEDDVVVDMPVVIARSPDLILGRAAQAFLDMLKRQSAGIESLKDYPKVAEEAPGLTEDDQTHQTRSTHLDSAP